MHLRGSRWGTQPVRIASGPLHAEDVLVAQALADVATIAIIQHQASVSASVLNGQLSEALNSRIIIEQAKARSARRPGSTWTVRSSASATTRGTTTCA